VEKNEFRIERLSVYFSILSIKGIKFVFRCYESYWGLARENRKQFTSSTDLQLKFASNFC